MGRAAPNALAATCLALALDACQAPLVPPPPIPAPQSPGLHVLLAWNEPVDLDLYVTDPSWETVYFANTPSRGGGRLEGDTRCDNLKPSGPQAEWARFAVPGPGPYRVGVDFIDDCGNDREKVSFRIIVQLGGETLETTGTVERERFKTIASEFELDAKHGKLIAKKGLHGGADDATE